MQQPGDVVYFWIAFVLYMIGFLGFTLYLAFKSKPVTFVSIGSMAVGFGFHTVALIIRWVQAGHSPFSNMYEYMSSMAWMSVLLFLVFLWRYKKPILGSFISPIPVMLMASASLMPKEISKQLMPALRSYWFEIHVSMAVLAEGAFAVAFGVSIMYLLRKKLGDKSNVRALPSLELLDDINYKAISIGYPLFTVGALFAGAIWAYNAWGNFWSWDPKETGALIIWLFYTVYLHARYQRGWRGSKAAWMSIIGFLMALASFFGNLVVGGMHAYI